MSWKKKGWRGKEAGRDWEMVKDKKQKPWEPKDDEQEQEQDAVQWDVSVKFDDTERCGCSAPS